MLLRDTSPAVTEHGEEGPRQCGGHSVGAVTMSVEAGRRSTTTCAHTHTAEVWFKKAFWSELGPKIVESYPWCPGSASGATQHALEEMGNSRQSWDLAQTRKLS